MKLFEKNHTFFHVPGIGSLQTRGLDSYLPWPTTHLLLERSLEACLVCSLLSAIFVTQSPDLRWVIVESNKDIIKATEEEEEAGERTMQGAVASVCATAGDIEERA